MHCSIGKQLGVLLAQYEEDLYKGGDDVETVRKVTLISEAYRNFIQSGKPSFASDFDSGYASMAAALEAEEPLPSDSALLGDYLGATGSTRG